MTSSTAIKYSLPFPSYLLSSIFPSPFPLLPSLSAFLPSFLSPSLPPSAFFLVIYLFGCFYLNAQVVTTQEETQKKKEINQIKLGEQAMYADVVEVASDDFEAVSLAKQRSINMLQTNVMEACAKKMNMSKEDVKEIFDIIDDKCQNVVIQKGDMLRVFSYIAKDAIGLGRKKASKEVNDFFAPEESDSLEMQKATEQAMGLVMGDNETINDVQTKKEEAQTANPVQQATQVAEQAALTVGQPAQVANQTVVVVQQPNQTNAVIPVVCQVKY